MEFPWAHTQHVNTLSTWKYDKIWKNSPMNLPNSCCLESDPRVHRPAELLSLLWHSQPESFLFQGFTSIWHVICMQSVPQSFRNMLAFMLCISRFFSKCYIVQQQIKLACFMLFRMCAHNYFHIKIIILT